MFPPLTSMQDKINNFRRFLSLQVDRIFISYENRTFQKGVAMRLIFFLIALFVNIAALRSAEPLELNSDRELFIDHYLIEQLNGVSLLLHHPHDEGPVLNFDKPWEGPFCGYVTVIKDKNLFRLYYRGLPEAGADGSNIESTCYAESRDGVRWVKPNLGIYAYKGSKNNNIILKNAAPVTHNFSPFLDTREGVNPKEKYKALGGTESSGLIAYVSEDGIHWKRLREKAVFKKGKFDSQNVSFWSQKEQRYICYFRTWTKKGYTGYRTVSRTTSKDFIHWSEPQKMDFGNTPIENLYTNQTSPYYRAPQIYVSVAARFMPKRQVISREQANRLGVNPEYFKDCSDAVLMTSRGGNRYTRTFMEAFIRPGIGLENWVSRTNYPALNVVQTDSTEMSVYVNQNYAQWTANLHRYSMRIDGFVSVNAPYKGGEMTTKPFTFRGDKLYVNFSTSAPGEIKVEIQDKTGRPIPGFTINDVHPLIGNEIDREVVWGNNENLKKLEGKTVRLKFVMKDADIYSLQFR